MGCGPRRTCCGVVRPRRCVLALLALPLLAACGGAERAEAIRLVGGDPSAGRVLIKRHGCPACHTIRGIAGANGLVGPPLTGIASRAYIAGVLSNSPANMVRWIVDPKAVDSLTAMPAVGVSEAEAKDMATYLYTLR